MDEHVVRDNKGCEDEKLRQCPACGALTTAGTCPHCGYANGDADDDDAVRTWDGIMFWRDTDG